jgi:hypothetical protein
VQNCSLAERLRRSGSHAATGPVIYRTRARLTASQRRYFHANERPVERSHFGERSPSGTFWRAGLQSLFDLSLEVPATSVGAVNVSGDL